MHSIGMTAGSMNDGDVIRIRFCDRRHCRHRRRSCVQFLVFDATFRRSAQTPRVPFVTHHHRDFSPRAFFSVLLFPDSNVICAKVSSGLHHLAVSRSSLGDSALISAERSWLGVRYTVKIAQVRDRSTDCESLLAVAVTRVNL